MLTKSATKNHRAYPVHMSDTEMSDTEMKKRMKTLSVVDGRSIVTEGAGSGTIPRP